MPKTRSFSLTEKQQDLRDVAATDARHVLGVGGSRSGKTFAFCYFIATRAMLAPESRHLIARKQNIDVRQAVLADTWPSMMRVAYPDVPYTVNKTDQFVTLDHNGAEIWFGGLDDKERVEKILGKEYVTVYVNECSQIAFDTVTTLRTRLAQNVMRVDGKPLALKAYYDLNPVGKRHWTYKEWIDLKRPGDDAPMDPATRAHVFLNPADNPHLPSAYLEELAALPERQRIRFLEGKYLTDVPGTLWPMERIDAARAASAPDLTRIVVALDPSGSDGMGGDSQGIVVAGLGVDGHVYVLEDATCNMSPAGWGARAVDRFKHWGADLIVAEANYGGAMVESTIKTVDNNVPVKLVSASRGKHIRAEPIAALYEDRPGHPARAHHVGKAFGELEDQMGSFTTSGFQGSGSPDRVDALVWALTELMLNNSSVEIIDY